MQQDLSENSLERFKDLPSNELHRQYFKKSGIQLTEHEIESATASAIEKMNSEMRENSAMAREMLSGNRRSMLGAAVQGGLSYLVLNHLWNRTMGQKVDGGKATTQEPAPPVAETAALPDVPEPFVRSDASFGSKMATVTWNSLLLKVGLGTGCMALNQLGIRTINAPITFDIKGDEFERLLDRMIANPGGPGEIFRKLVFTGPLKEEFFYRLLPSYLVKNGAFGMEVAIPSSIAFAAMHNIVPRDRNDIPGVPLTEKHKFAVNTIPLPQFVAGAFFWYTMQRQGFPWAVYAHSLSNLQPALMMVMGHHGAIQKFEHYRHEALLSMKLKANYAPVNASAPLAPSQVARGT